MSSINIYPVGVAQPYMVINLTTKRTKELFNLRKRGRGFNKNTSRRKYNLPYVNLSDLPIENEALRVISEKDADKKIAPFKILGKDVYIAVRSPIEDEMTNIRNKLMDNGYVAHFYMASLASLEKVWERYTEISFASESKAGTISVPEEVLKKIMNDVKNINDIKESITKTLGDNTHTTSKILEIAIGGAISINASDIHFEPEEDFVRLRFRLDGVLQEVIQIPHSSHKLINSRIKLLSGLKITSAAIAQDGRFSIFLDQDEINMRVSTMPGSYGESIVMRILNPKSIKVKLEDMGIESGLLIFYERNK